MGHLIQSLGAVGLIQLFLVASGIAIARSLGPSGRGDVAVIMALPPVVMQLVCIGFPSALTYFVARHRGAWDVLARRLLLPALLQVACGTGLLVVLDLIFLSGKTHDALAAGFIVIISFPCIVFQYYTVHLVQGLGDIRWFNVLRMSSTGTYSLGIAAGAFIGLTVMSCAVIWVVSQALVALVAAGDLLRRRRLDRQHAPRQLGDIPTAGALARFAFAGFIAQVSPIESFRLDTLAVAALFPSRIVGYYSVANSMTNVPLFTADALSAVGYPHVAAENGESAVVATRRYMRLAWLLCGGAAAVTMLLVPFALPALFGSAYAPATMTAEILACAAAVLGLRRIGNDFLRALGRPASSTRLEVVTLLTFAACLIVLGPVGNGRGVAASLIVSAALGLALFNRLLRNLHDATPANPVAAKVVRH